MKRRAVVNSRSRMLEAIPCRNPGVLWQDMDNGELTASYRRHLTGWRKLIAKVIQSSEVATLVLDHTGAKVVGQIDGQRTIADLIAFVANEFHLSRKEAEVALLKYIEMLASRRLVGLAMPTGPGEDA